IADETNHEPDGKGDVKDRVEQDEPEIVVDQPELAVEDIDRNDQGYRRHSAQQEKKICKQLPPKPEARNAVCCWHAEAQGCQHTQGRNSQAVFEIEPAVAAREQPVVVDQRWVRWQPYGWKGEIVLIPLQGRGQDPQERKEEKHQRHRHPKISEEYPQKPPHAIL